MFHVTMSLILLSLARNASPTKNALLDQVRSVTDLESLSFVAEYTQDIPKIGRRHPAFKGTRRVKVFMADGPKFRVEGFENDALVTTVISDGNVVTEWDAAQNLWTRYEMPVFNEKYFFRPLIIEDSVFTSLADSWTDERGPFVPWLERIVARPETIVLEPAQVGERMCDVLHYDFDIIDWHFPPFSGNEKRTLYFDPDSHLLVRQEVKVSAKSMFFISYKGSSEVNYLDLQPNVLLADDTFQFTPPPDAKFIEPDDPRIIKAVPAGEPAPDIELALVDGKSVALHEILKGKVGLVSFWATWCGPCIEEMPSLAKLHEEFSDRGLAVVGVSRDSSMNMVKTFVRSRPMPYTLAHDADNMGAEKYYFEAIPHTVLIGRDGKVVKTWQGWGGEEEEAEIREEIVKLLGDE